MPTPSAFSSSRTSTNAKQQKFPSVVRLQAGKDQMLPRAIAHASSIRLRVFRGIRYQLRRNKTRRDRSVHELPSWQIGLRVRKLWWAGYKQLLRSGFHKPFLLRCVEAFGGEYIFFLDFRAFKDSVWPKDINQ